MATVSLEHISKSYDGGNTPAVDNVSIDIADGEFMVLLGPSGCGKSTTLRMIAGLEAISAGTLRIDERIVNKVPAKDRDIAMVFQSYALYPHMTVKDNLAFGLRRRGIDRAAIEQRVGEVAAMLGLSELLKRKPYALSGGQRQRVALGRAIVRDPKVFLFDEPLSNLDAALRVSTRNELIKQHQRLGATMVYVTHDQVEAMTMGQRICIMNQGKVVQIGAPLEVYRQPADTFVAKFLGNPPMNLLAAELIQHDGQLHLRCAGQLLPLPDHAAVSLDSYLNGSVIVGIRPEDLYETVPADVSENVAKLPGRVVTVEPLGAETLLTLQLDDSDQELIARVGRDSAVRVGDSLHIVADLGALHLFDAQTTRAVDRNSHT